VKAIKGMVILMLQFIILACKQFYEEHGDSLPAQLTDNEKKKMDWLNVIFSRWNLGKVEMKRHSMICDCLM